jgi:hypothetical protein
MRLYGNTKTSGIPKLWPALQFRLYFTGFTGSTLQALQAPFYRLYRLYKLYRLYRFYRFYRLPFTRFIG